VESEEGTEESSSVPSCSTANSNSPPSPPSPLKPPDFVMEIVEPERLFGLLLEGEAELERPEELEMTEPPALGE
jgi:hypothetical protein